MLDRGDGIVRVELDDSWNRRIQYNIGRVFGTGIPALSSYIYVFDSVICTCSMSMTRGDLWWHHALSQ